ncbi:MAG: IPT/TIG domain-containing protein, partial [Thermoanaerobaculia bacterium]
GATTRVKVDQLPEGIAYCQWYTATALPPREGTQTTVKDLKKAEAEPGYTVQPRPAPPPPPKPGLKLAGKVRAKVKTKSGTQTQWIRYFTVTAGDTDVHDIHVELTTRGAKFVGPARGPKGWGDGKISKDGRSITFDKGTGKPIKAGEKSKLTFTTLEKDVHFDWYFTDEKKQKITDAEGEQLAAVFDHEKRLAVRIDTVTPGAVPAGSVITVVGDGFGTRSGDLAVEVGAADATTLQVTDDEILAVVPDTASGTGLTVSRGGHTSNVFPFHVVPSLSTNLAEPLTVTRGGVAEVVVEVIGSEETETVQLISTDPAVATFTGTVVEETEVAPGEQQTVPLYGLAAGSVIPFVRLLSRDPKPAVTWDPETDPPLEELLAQTDQPVIVDLVPSECHVEEPVVIEGANFGEDPEAVRVELGNQPLQVLEVTPDRIVALVPEDARSGGLQVYRNGRAAYKEARLEVQPSLRMSVSQEVVKKGRRTLLTTAIVGTDEPQEIDVYCPTPAMATFEDGAVHRRVVTSGGTPNQVSLPVQTHQVGRFEIKGIVRGEPAKGNRWLELEPAELALAPSGTTPISVFLVEQVNGQWHREAILPDRILLAPEAGTATREGILDAGEPGEHLVLIEAGGLQAVLELVIDSAH